MMYCMLSGLISTVMLFVLGGWEGEARVGRGEAAILSLGAATVQVGCHFLLLDVDCFNDLQLCVVQLHLLTSLQHAVPAVLDYPSTTRGGCLLTQCDMTTLLLACCVLTCIQL